MPEKSIPENNDVVTITYEIIAGAACRAGPDSTLILCEFVSLSV